MALGVPNRSISTCDKMLNRKYFIFISACPQGKWGEDCGNDCPCLNGANCNPLSGECTCTPGWHGKQYKLPM